MNSEVSGVPITVCATSHSASLLPWLPPAGAYGVVNLCVDRRTGREYACKVLPKVRGRLTPAKTAKKIWQEVELLSRVQSCGNVARLQSVFEDDDRVYIVLELCQGGDLEQLLEVLRFEPVSALLHPAAPAWTL